MVVVDEGLWHTAEMTAAAAASQVIWIMQINNAYICSIIIFIYFFIF
jgi:hypothetical protein